MVQAYMIQGGDITVAVNGSAVGGIYELTVRDLDEPHLIKEFLSDEPVGKIPQKRYIIKIKAHSADGCAWAKAPVQSVAVGNGVNTEIYTDCTVTECETKAQPRGLTDHIITIHAGKRGVSYG